ncbi:MAG: UDP-N-acetylmuramate dehydrogenase [Clostridiales Family XIII bacterium]|nr:UDP-N-acetylmuramate dehydrogenase [Clostridiales Family XIII bacterium]
MNKKNVLLKDLISMKVGGKARELISPETVDELIFLVKKLYKNDEKFFILGNGTNVMFSDEGFDGVIVSLISIKGEVNAFTSLSKFAKYMTKNGYEGFSGLAGIPGLIGGGIYMNAGAYDDEIKDNLLSVKVYDIREDKEKIFDKKELDFSYRHSIFQEERISDNIGRYIILNAKFNLIKGNKDALILKMNESLKKRKEKQPLEYPSAGSFFKRPKNNFAGKLISDAGLPGYKIGGAMVSKKHAGFIINYDNATSNDIIKLQNFIIKTVYEKFEIKLEAEVIYIR